MKKHLTNRVLSMLLVLAMLLSNLAVPAAAVGSESLVADLSFTQTQDFTAHVDEAMQAEAQVEDAYDADELVRVSIVLEDKPTVQAGFSTKGIAANAAAQAYRAELEKNQAQVTAAIEKTTGQTLDVQWNLTLAANIISANVPYGQIEQISAVKGVKDVIIEQQYETCVVDGSEKVDPNTATSDEMIGTSGAYSLGYTGAGSRIAIVDTGLDLDHQSFDAEAYEYSLSLVAAQNKMTYPQYVESLDRLDVDGIDEVLAQTNAIKRTKTLTAEDVYKTSKVPFAYNYVDKSATKVDHTTDSQGGHGSHVAGIAAANRYIPNGDGTYSVAVDAVSATGVAPDAQILVLKVFGSKSPSESDYMAAIEDAIILDCDSVNLSLGSNSAGRSFSATYQELMDSLENTDTNVVISAGNSGHFADSGIHAEPGYLYAEDVNMHTGGSPGSYINSLTVASVDNVGTTGHYLCVDEQLIFYTETVFGNALLRTIAGDYEYIFLDSIGTAEEWAAVADVLEGKIAICSRGTTSFFEKAEAAVNNGAVATIIYNNQPGSINMDLSTYTKTEPCVSITQAEGAHIKSNSEPVTNEDGEVLYYTGTMTISAGIGVAMNEADFYTMSSFSSYGVPGTLLLKPEISAPGGNIYSVDGEIDGGKDYITMSGTSMAAPQISGMAALMSQYIQESGLTEKTGLSQRTLINSLLMSTAEAMEQSEGKPYPVFRQGAGLADVGAAINANSYVLMGADATESWSDGKIKAELGSDGERTGVYTFSFTLNDLSGEDQQYMLYADLFTQDTFTSGEYTYMDTVTEALQGKLTWTVNGEVLEPAGDISGHDVNGDGLVNTGDVSAILDYCVDPEQAPAFLEKGDMDADGDTDTYDAYLLLKAVNTGLAQLEANGSAEITVTVELTAEQKAQLDADFVNGAYIQGYFYAQQLPTADGELGTVHSIPMLAFYGEWADARMYDYSSRDGYYYDDQDRAAYTDPTTNYMTVQYDDAGSLTTYVYAGNPYYRLEDTNPLERWAIKSSTTLYQSNAALIRAAGARMIVITDQNGDVVYMNTPATGTPAYFYAAAGTWQYTATVQSFRQKVGALGAREGDVLTVYDLSIPEYYTTDGMTGEELWDLYQTGFLGENAVLKYSFTVDNQAPELLGVQKDLLTGELTISARDNNYIASIQVQSPGGTLFNHALPEQDGKQEVGTVTIDLSEYQDMIGQDVLVVLCDYAKNESAYLVHYGNPEMDYTGKMFAFTESKYRGGGQRWMYIDPDTVWFNNQASDSYGYGGTLNMQTSELNIQAAEYVGGYVYMAAMDGNFYVAEQGDWSSCRLAGRYKSYTGTIKDMAFNYADGKLYALDASSTIWTVDLQTLAMEKVTTVTLYFPFSLGLMEQLNGTANPAMLGIDDEGTFYLVNGAANAGKGYLFSFTAEDIGTGIEGGSGGGKPIFPGIGGLSDGEQAETMVLGTPATGLHPINDTKDGGITRYTTVGSLAWDHDKDILYMTASTGSDNTGFSSYILQMDTETGAAYQTNAITGGFDMGCPSRLQTPARALYIVPSQSVEIANQNFATSVQLNKTAGKALAGAQFTLEATVYPWNVTDHSVTWTSSDESVATVDRNGVVSLLTEGEVTITATSVLNPELSDDCTITVEPMPSVQLTALVTDPDGNSYWTEFHTDDVENLHKVKAEENLYFAGTLSNGMVIAHNNAAYFGMDPDTFESLGQLGALGNMFRFSDCAESPEHADGKFGTEVVSVANSGTYFEILNYETHRVAYLSVASDLNNDPMATIAFFKSSGSNNYYYVLTEGGQLWQFYVTQSSSGGYSIGKSKLGDTGMKLPGVSTVTGGSTASMHYDQESGYLFILASLGNKTELFVMDPVSMVWSKIGQFGEGVYPAVALYEHHRDTNLTVKMSQNLAYLYMDGTLELSASVLPIDMDPGVVWSSADETIATVDENGVVTPVAPGTVDIIATTVTTDAEGNTAQGVCQVVVKDVSSVDAVVKAQLRNDDGTADWVTIDLNDMEITVDKANAQHLFGGGVHNGIIHGTDIVFDGNGGNFFEIDPSNDYAVDRGIGASDSYGYLDGTTSPAGTMQVRNPDGSMSEVDYFGHPMILNSNGDFFALYDHHTYEQGYGWGLWNWYSDVSAVAYMGTGTSGAYTSHLYYFLGADGNLYSLEIWPTGLNSEGQMGYSSARATLGNVGMSFNEREVTMTYVRNGDTEGLVIGQNGENNVELYYVDLTEEELTCGKMGELEGTMSISTLHTEAELNGTVGAYTTPDADVSEGQTSMIMVSAGTEYEMDSQNDETSDGGLNVVKGYVAPTAADTEHDCAEGIAKVIVTADSETTNGLLTVEYDAEALELLDAKTNGAFTSVLVEDGKIRMAYADTDAIPANGKLLELTFAADTASTVTVTVEEDGDTKPGTVQEIALAAADHHYEAAETVEPTCTEDGYIVWVCADCGDTWTEALGHLGHTLTSTVVEATCTTEGYTEHTCSVCGILYRDSFVDPLGHSYDAVVTEPTCTEGGYTTYTCSVCGDTYVADYTDPYCASEGFVDVELDVWYHEAVDYVVENGLMNGISDTIFAPEADMTRGQMVTVLYRMAGSPEVTEAAPFTDVVEGSFCDEAVAWAYANGIAMGTSADTFEPDASISRQQMVTFLARYAAYTGMDVESSYDLSGYTDADSISAYAVQSMAWAVENGLINGISATTLAPGAIAVRAQVAMVLMRLSSL